jgi:hypothetical protein
LPAASLTSSRVSPVSVLVAWTTTPGMAAPCWSVMRPATVPVVNCARAGEAPSATARIDEKPIRTNELQVIDVAAPWEQ